MNDFTKDELEILKVMMMHIKITCPQIYPTCSAMQDKIQLMIDNYYKTNFDRPDQLDGSFISSKYNDE